MFVMDGGNGIYLDSSGQYLDTLINSNGCDSLVNLDLTVNTNSSFNFITSCDNYQMNELSMILLHIYMHVIDKSH